MEQRFEISISWASELLTFDILGKSGKSSITWKMVKQGENGSFGTPRKGDNAMPLFCNFSDIISEVQKWKSQLKVEINLGTLFLLFLDFYSNVIDFKLQKVNVAKGELRIKGKK